MIKKQHLDKYFVYNIKRWHCGEINVLELPMSTFPLIRSTTSLSILRSMFVFSFWSVAAWQGLRYTRVSISGWPGGSTSGPARPDWGHRLGSVSVKLGSCHRAEVAEIQEVQGRLKHLASDLLEVQAVEIRTTEMDSSKDFRQLKVWYRFDLICV